MIYYWGSSGWVVVSSETDCDSRFILEQFHQRQKYRKIICFSTFWHTLTSTFHVHFIFLNLLSCFHSAQYPQGFAYLSVASGGCFYLWQLFPHILIIGYCIRLLYIFIISQFAWWFKYCLSTRKIFFFNRRLAVGQTKIVLPMLAVKIFR